MAARYATDARIQVLSLAELADLPKNAVDLCVMHSVAQYMTAAEFDTALDLIKSLLKPHGLLVLGDIVCFVSVHE